jgi:hypothetical protein
MNIESFVATTRTRTVAITLTAAYALFGSALAAHAAWQHAHGDAGNTGFEMVDTAPAYWAQQQPLGSIAPGANPVVGPDGTVYIGNVQGELRAFHADGTPYWTRQINSTHGGFFAAPVVGADGSIYIVSSLHYTDHRGGVTNERNDSFLHKFLPGGAWVFVTPFPEHSSADPSVANRGATTAPPNIWRFNGTEAIMVPVVYKTAAAVDLRVIAFSTSGAVLADHLVPRSSPVTTGGSDFLGECIRKSWWSIIGPIVCTISAPLQEYTGTFHSDGSYVPLDGIGWPLPGVAIRSDPQGGAPFVMVTNGIHDKFAYTFSPQTGFSQVARSSHLRRRFTTPPVVLPNGDTLTGTHDGYLTRTSPSFGQSNAISGLGTLTAAPTRLSDGGLVVVSREGTMTVQRGHRTQRQLAGESIASAAASCNHIFVSTTNSFETLDRKTLAQVASIGWVGGGLHSPIIGPSGHVYAIASNNLYVFPPPWKPVWDTRPPSCFLLPPVLRQ